MVVQRFLLDSHALIWFLYEPDRIGTRTKKLLLEANVVYVSAVSFLELAGQHAAGKLKYTPQALIEGAEVAGLETLPLTAESALRLQNVDATGGDTYDTLLVAQCLAEQCTLLTADERLIGSVQQARDIRS